MLRPDFPFPRFIFPALASLQLFSCNDPGSGPAHGPEGDDLPACGESPYFTVVPAPEESVNWSDVVGRLAATQQTLPKRHMGLVLKSTEVPIVSPGDIVVHNIRRNRYVESPNRTGEEDYSIHFNVCKDVYGFLGHLTTLDSATFPSLDDWDHCESYNTADETIEACELYGLQLPLTAGQPVGTAGRPGSPAVDLGLFDERIRHVFAAPGRFDGQFPNAISQFEYYDSASQDFFYAKLFDPAVMALDPTVPAPEVTRPDYWGEPRFGTVAVDVPETAQGIWAEPGGDWSVVAEQHRFIVLANNPYRPSAELMLSLGPDALGGGTFRTSRETSGRVNRLFADITPGSGIHCYFGSGLTGNYSTAQASWLVELPTADSLRIERRTHAAGESPCADDPATWSFGSGAMTLVR